MLLPLLHQSKVCVACNLTSIVSCRGEYVAERLALELAVKEAYDKGFIGKNACGSGMDFDVMVTYGAGAYICGMHSCLVKHFLHAATSHHTSACVECL